MLVIAVGFFDSSGGASVALVARRAAKLIRVVNFQQIGLGMAGEGAGVLVGLFALERHGYRGEFDGLANAHVAGLASVHDFGFGHIGLHDFRIPSLGFFLPSCTLLVGQSIPAVVH